MMRISCPSIQKWNIENADVFTIRRRYVLPGCKRLKRQKQHAVSETLLPTSNGSVAFSLKPTAAVTESGCVPAMGPRYVAFCAK